MKTISETPINSYRRYEWFWDRLLASWMETKEQSSKNVCNSCCSPLEKKQVSAIAVAIPKNMVPFCWLHSNYTNSYMLHKLVQVTNYTNSLKLSSYTDSSKLHKLVELPQNIIFGCWHMLQQWCFLNLIRRLLWNFRAKWSIGPCMTEVVEDVLACILVV